MAQEESVIWEGLHGCDRKWSHRGLDWWARLTLNPDKCQFFVPKVHILGHQRDEKGIRPSEEKLGTFREWPTPNTK